MSDSEPPDDQTVWQQGMPFITVQSVGGPHEDEAYVCGFEMGGLDITLSLHLTDHFHMVLHTSNIPQADLLAMKHGYTVEFETEGEWSHGVFLHRHDTLII